MDQLLTTKTNIPSTRPDLVPRPRLVERLNGGLYRKITLISAPAGFGKTTLVTSWLAQIGKGPQEEKQITYDLAWVSLDGDDNDPARFLAYLIAAISRANVIDAVTGDGLLSMLQSNQSPAAESVLIPLINEIATHSGRVILVFDDYHVIHLPQVNEALTFLLENQPEQLHLVITSREDPDLPISRLRVRDQLTELRAADLRFTSTEAAEFLNQVMGLNLSDGDIITLDNRTEGWIAGLQLAAISLQGREDTTQRIESFSGSHRIILDYLIEEVLDQQPDKIQSFLLQTSILDRMNGALCDALTSQDDGQQTLEYLEHANLFIVPLDDQGQWYRYHHLFADLLKQRLERTLPEQLPVLQRKASDWFLANGYPDQAIVHALRAKDYEWAVVLLGQEADALWQRGEHGKLRAWLEIIPAEFLLSDPLLTILRAYYLHSVGQQEEGNHLLQEAERLIVSGNELSEEDRHKLLSRFEVIRALIYTFTGDVPGMIKHSNQALELLPYGETTWRSLAAFTLGDAYSYQGDMAASYQARSEALRVCEESGDAYYTIVAALKLASTLKEQGELQQTMQLCQQQMQQVNKYSFSQVGSVGCLMALWGEVLAELDDLDGAIDQARRGAEIAERGGNLTILGYSYIYLLRVLLSRGDLDGAEEIIQKARKLNRETTLPPWFNSQMANWQVRIWLERGELEAGTRWVAERGWDTDKSFRPPAAIDYLTLFDYILLARILIAQRQVDKAAGLLESLEEHAENGGRITRLIEILILQAIAYQIEGEISRSMVPLERALAIAEPLGFIRTFVDEGQDMASLLYEALSRDISPEYVSLLLNAFPSAKQNQTEPLSSSGPTIDLVEPLSEREIEVLQLIAEGLTNPEIASRLYLSLNTIKVHTRNIFGKLGVNNRTQAVSVANSLGIL